MTTRRARRNFDALYADLPTLACQGKCAESCGPIAMSRTEWERIIETIGQEPVPSADGVTCPLLANERCTVYAVRPTLCRLWGLVESMPCRWGCEPSRRLTDVEGYEFLRRAEGLSA